MHQIAFDAAIFSSPVRAKQLDNAATSISQMESKLLLGFVYDIIRIPYVALKRFMAFIGGYIKQSIQVWFALWFPFKILSANHEVMLQCLLRACYCWILLSSFLSSWCFQVQTKLESWTISFCWQFRGGGAVAKKHESDLIFGPNTTVATTLRHLGPECTQESHVTGRNNSTDQRISKVSPVAFRWKPSYATWGGGRFATHTSHLSPRRGDRIWRGSRKGREGQAMQHFHETSTKWNCGTFLFSTCFNL